MSPTELENVLLEILNNAPCVAFPDDEYRLFFPRRCSLGYRDLAKALPNTDERDIAEALQRLTTAGRVKKFLARIHEHAGGYAHYFVPTDKAHLLQGHGRTRGL